MVQPPGRCFWRQAAGHVSASSRCDVSGGAISSHRSVAATPHHTPLQLLVSRLAGEARAHGGLGSKTAEKQTIAINILDHEASETIIVVR